jgi:uncharacterized protein
MYIKRTIFKNIQEKLFQGKVIFLLGARQVGKTTLAKEVLKTFPKEKVLKLDGDYMDDREMLDPNKIHLFLGQVENKDLIFIDEAQKIFNISETLKIFVDKFKNKKQILVTGSSSFNLLNKSSEALTGRKIVFELFPLSFQELEDSVSDEREFLRSIEQNLIFGFYPEIVLKKSREERIEALEELSSSYLYRDVLEFEDIKKLYIVDRLLKLLALQISSELSFVNLSKTLGIDKKTVEKYINVLEKSFVIKLLAPYSSGGKQEITKKHKVYFLDLGIRNALINNYNSLDLRPDLGQLWKNFLLIERIKLLRNYRIPTSTYFWRTYQGQELDFIESREDKLWGYEFKYNQKNVKAPKNWENYKNSSYQLINKENFQDFLSINSLS